MSTEIGTTAGKVWNYLNQNGVCAVTKLPKAIGADAALTNQAIGWLAREGKLKIERSKSGVSCSLAK